MGLTRVDPGVVGGIARLVTEGSPDLHAVTTVDGVYRLVSPAGRALFVSSVRDIDDRVLGAGGGA